jgi:hypothetical protein
VFFLFRGSFEGKEMAMAMMRRTVAAALWKGIKGCMQQREVVGSFSSSSAGFFVLLENQSLVVKRTREFWSLGLGCWAQQQVRLASTEIVSHTSGDDRGLLRVLKAEIEHEDVAYHPPRVIDIFFFFFLVPFLFVE